MSNRLQRPRITPVYLPTYEDITADDLVDPSTIPYDDPRYTRTKFGGLTPFFNPESHWPLCVCGRPQTFLGQVNLADGTIPQAIRETLAAGGGEGIFQLFWCPDNGEPQGACMWQNKLKDRFTAQFIKPRPPCPSGPQSLTGLAARRIADEILAEAPPPVAARADHPLLHELPPHVQESILVLIRSALVEATAAKQRRYCTAVLKDTTAFLAFDHREFNPAATGKGTPEYDTRVEDEELGSCKVGMGALCFSDVDVFTGWEVKPMIPDWNETEWGDGHFPWDIVDDGTTVANGEELVEGHDQPSGVYQFLGWPCWNPGMSAEYPPCPNDPSHGICWQPILQSHRVEAFNISLLYDFGWYVLLKCPLCLGFGVTEENPCLH